MARKPGTPAGEVNRTPKACGWSMHLTRQFSGRGSAVMAPLVGSEIGARLEALEDAFEDAAEQAFDYIVEQYDRLNCKAPCHKSWTISVQAPEGAAPFTVIMNVLKLVSLILSGGLSIEAANMREDAAAPGVTRFSASVILKCNYRIECATGDHDKAAPDPDQQLDTMRRILEMIRQAFR